MIKFFSSWEKIALDKKLKSFELCKSDGLPVLFLQNPKPAKFRILIAAGFHGNEPAGREFCRRMGTDPERPSRDGKRHEQRAFINWVINKK